MALILTVLVLLDLTLQIFTSVRVCKSFPPEWGTFRAGACFLSAMLLELCVRGEEDA